MEQYRIPIWDGARKNNYYPFLLVSSLDACIATCNRWLKQAERQRRVEKMNYIYILIGTLFTVALVAQLVSYAASTKKTKVKTEGYRFRN